MRIAILWTGLSGYSAACWKRLAETPGVELFVQTLASGKAVRDTAFDISLSEGLTLRSTPHDELSVGQLASDLRNLRPDLTLVAGWSITPYWQVINDPSVPTGAVLMGVDNPWKSTWRQKLSGLRRRRLAACVDGVLVPGERSAQFIRWMGVPAERIHPGLYAYDDTAFYPDPAPPPPPPRFLFVGRYVEPKGIHSLLEAHHRYTQQTPEPWPLACCGTGPLGELLDHTPGVSNLGFTQPDGLRHEIIRSAALVMPSHFEHWGVIVAEALACGRPVVCSNTTGCIPELIREGYNGHVYGVHNASALADVLQDLTNDPAGWRRMAQVAPAHAAPYAASAWPERILRIAKKLGI